jgi:hypothetical protein
MRLKVARKKKKSGLLLQHLENVSWKVLEDYRNVVRDMIRGRTGVYALYYRKKLYYVGLASNMMGRLKTHLKDRHNGEWDRFSVYLTADSKHIKELESLLLRISKPEGNRQTGNFAGAKNLLRDLDQRIRNVEADHRAILLGGHVAKRRLRSRVRHGHTSVGLIGISERRIPLRATCKGKPYRATLRKDGTIGYKGEIYTSPSAAARKVVGRAVNGLWFWNYRDDSGTWVKLRTINK